MKIVNKLELYQSVFFCTFFCCGYATTFFAALPLENTSLRLCRRLKIEQRHILIQVFWIIKSNKNQVIRLAAQGKNKPLHHVSTTAVFESDFFAQNHDEISENVDLRTHYNGLRGGYAQSKWTAELLVSQARDRGIKANIYRPAYISGDLKNGVWTTDDFLCRVLRGCLQVKFLRKMQDFSWCLSEIFGYILDYIYWEN